MKKIIASALGLMLGGTLLASTAQADVENQFGGYWRTRFSFQDNMASVPGDSKFSVDTRTRIYYTAKFSDNLKFVNKFEWNSTWGDTVGGDIGTDGMGIFRIKNSYADAMFGAINVKVGAHAGFVNRGFVFDDDFMGITASGNFGGVTPFVLWGRTKDYKSGGADYDQNLLSAGASIKAGDMVTIKPAITALIGSKESSDTTVDLVTGIGEPLETTTTETTTVGDDNLIWLGVDVDVKLDPVKLWGTFVYQTGDRLGVDSAAFATGLGVDANFVHGKFYYATGDDASDPSENTAYTAPSPYVVTAEIIGIGSTIDATYGPGIPAWDFTNVMLVNVGTTLKPNDKMTISVDGWYGMLAEDNEFGNTDLGFEIDGKLTVKLVDNLKADIFAAYLIAGDAINDAAQNTDDVFEGGVRLSLSF